MTAEKRRILRMVFKGALLICLPLTGFLWALPTDSPLLSGAALLTMVSIIVGMGAEIMASSTEAEIKELSVRFAEESRKRGEELAQRDEKIHQFDRIVQLLTEQNHTLRAKLLSVHTELQAHREVVAAKIAEVELEARNKAASTVEDLMMPRRAAYGGSTRAH